MQWVRDAAKLIFRGANEEDEKQARSNHFQFYRFTDLTTAAWNKFRSASEAELVPEIACHNAQGPISLCNIQDEVEIPRSRVMVQVELDATFTCWDAVALGLYVFKFARNHEPGEKVPHPARDGVFLNENTLKLIQYAVKDLDQSQLDLYVRYMKRSAHHGGTLALGWGALCVATQVGTGFPLAALSMEYFLGTLCSLATGSAYAAYTDPSLEDKMYREYSTCEIDVPWELYEDQLQSEIDTLLVILRDRRLSEEKRIPDTDPWIARRSTNPFDPVNSEADPWPARPNTNPFDAVDPEQNRMTPEERSLVSPASGSGETSDLDPWGQPYER
jgi:hypothetical protein